MRSSSLSGSTAWFFSPSSRGLWSAPWIHCKCKGTDIRRWGRCCRQLRLLSTSEGKKHSICCSTTLSSRGTKTQENFSWHHLKRNSRYSLHWTNHEKWLQFRMCFQTTVSRSFNYCCPLRSRNTWKKSPGFRILNVWYQDSTWRNAKPYRKVGSSKGPGNS